MKGDRMSRVNQLLREALSALVRKVRDPRVRTPEVLGISEVRASPDLRQAKVYVSVGGAEDDPARAAAVAGLHDARGFLRGELGRSVRLKHVPELVFVLDRTVERAAHLEAIFAELQSERAGGETDGGSDGEPRHADNDDDDDDDDSDDSDDSGASDDDR